LSPGPAISGIVSVSCEVRDTLIRYKCRGALGAACHKARVSINTDRRGSGARRTALAICAWRLRLPTRSAAGLYIIKPYGALRWGACCVLAAGPCDLLLSPPALRLSKHQLRGGLETSFQEKVREAPVACLWGRRPSAKLVLPCTWSTWSAFCSRVPRAASL